MVNRSGKGKYAQVRVWVHKKSGALIQVVGYNAAGRPLKRFQVESIMKVGDTFTLRRMRVDTIDPVPNRVVGVTYIEFDKPITADEAREILREAPGCLVVDKREDGGYVTPHECAGEDATYISRIREDSTIENGLNIWVVSDNLRKGAALNAIQIAELLDRQYLKRLIAAE